MDYNKITWNIRKELSEYINDWSLKSLVIGVSGGIDSAVCCALASPVCKDLGIPLIGRSIPIKTNKQDEIERARNIGKTYCDDFKEVDLEATYEIFHNSLAEDIAPDNERIALGNLKARLRMILLYNLASNKKGMVLSTDNRTEFLLGFWTIAGDIGDYGMIQNLWKTEVYGLAKHLNNDNRLTDCINACPTDGLGITETSLDQIGAKSYEEVDIMLNNYLSLTSDSSITCNPREKSKLITEYQTHPVIKRHLRTDFKRNIPFNIPRENLM